MITLFLSQGDFCATASLVQVIAQNPQVKLWDPFDVLCPENASNSCNVFRDGKPLFFDQDHLSGYGNFIVYNDFVSFISTVEKEASTIALATSYR
jgi:hypothetical protein